MHRVNKLALLVVGLLLFMNVGIFLLAIAVLQNRIAIDGLNQKQALPTHQTQHKASPTKPKNGNQGRWSIRL